jgi:anti-anti-sigma factor
MLHATIQKLGDTTVLHCKGRIVIGEAYSILRASVFNQRQARLLVLDLTQVECIDAGGLGALLGIREWAHTNAIRFKLMNLMKNVEPILELTRLDRVFEFCSVRDLICLLHRASVMTSELADQSHPADAKDHWSCLMKGQEAVPAVERDRLLAWAS